MVSTSVSESGKNFYNGIIIRDLNYQLQSMMAQVSTGKKAQTYGQLGGDTTTSLSLRAKYNGLDGYLSAINTVKLRTETMSTAMRNISDSATDILSKMNAISEGGVPDLSVIKNAAQNALSEITQRINARVDGKYVFAGDNSGLLPISNTTSASTNIATQLAAYQSGTPAATVIANIDALTEAQLGFDSNLAASGNVKVRVDDNLNIDYTVKGDETGFKDMIKGLSMVANLNYDPAHPDDFWTLYKEAKSRVDSGARAVDLRNGQLGVARTQMNDLIQSHKDLQLVVENNIADVENVDVAQVSSNLETLKFQLQATYATISQTSQLSILNYLK